MKITTPLAALALATAAALTLSSCSTTADQPNTGEQLRVVTTTTQLTDFAAAIGGDEIDLTGLLAIGASAHHFDPSPADLLALGQADVLIVNGAGLDEFVESAVEASGFAGTVIDASNGVDLELAREITLEAAAGVTGEHEHHGHDEADHDHEHDAAEHDHDGETHDHGETDHDEAHAHDHGSHDHDHGDLNPHLWTSPRIAQDMVHEIGHGLATADPENAALFEQRAADYSAQLDVLDAWIVEQYERIPVAERLLVTGHDGLRYYLHDYDITYVGALLPSFEDNAEPSAAQVDELVAEIRASGVKAIFVESSLSPKLAETVAKEAGVQVVTEESLYVDSLGAIGSGADTYISATAHNTRAILEAWGVAVDPLPANLESM